MEQKIKNVQTKSILLKSNQNFHHRQIPCNQKSNYNGAKITKNRWNSYKENSASTKSIQKKPKKNLPAPPNQTHIIETRKNYLVKAVQWETKNHSWFWFKRVLFLLFHVIGYLICLTCFVLKGHQHASHLSMRIFEQVAISTNHPFHKEQDLSRGGLQQLMFAQCLSILDFVIIIFPATFDLSAELKRGQFWLDVKVRWDS